MKKLAVISILALMMVSISSSPAFEQGNERTQAEHLFVQAQKALADGNEDGAESLLKESLNIDPSFTSSIWQLAQIYERQGKLEFARELMLRGLKIEPNATWAKEKLSQIEKSLSDKLIDEIQNYMAEGQYEKAIPKLSLYKSMIPDDPLPYTLLGRCHLALGHLDSARGFLLTSLRLNPSDTRVGSLLDIVDEKIKRSSLDSMVERAKKLLADYEPSSADEARKVLDEILAKDPQNAWAKEKLADLDLVIAKRKKDESSAKKKEEMANRSRAIVSKSKNAFLAALRGLSGHLTAIILGLTAVLLFFDLKKKVSQKKYPLQGSLSLIPILDIVSLVNSNLKTGRMIITTNRIKGEIFFEKGEIVHARWKGYDGKKAFQKLMELKNGSYYFLNHLPKIKHTISEPLSVLLLSMTPHREAPKSTDEKAAETDEFFAKI
ncbi:MAG: hypothetical protein B6D63_01905 [Candidatus Latescibacteria bacterium 4484_7]|nr:MAG: hypothetical protein B6D63_01905 [Candidatus Latescibacteria bacterium 4484_7]